MISKTEEYALRAVVALATQFRGAPVSTHELARSTGVPANYLSKILHQLGRAGVVTSSRGRHGGFQLARPADEISLASVVEPFGPAPGRERCVLGRPECSDVSPCGAHSRWRHVKGHMLRFLADTTVDDVVGRGVPER